MNNASNPYAGKVVAVAIKKGGTGKSLISLNIAPEINNCPVNPRPMRAGI